MPSVGVIMPDRDRLAHSNHFLTDRFVLGDRRVVVRPNSLFRKYVADRALENVSDANPVKSIKEMLADHSNTPESVCAHPPAGRHMAERTATLAGVIFDFQRGVVEIAEGNPCTGAYREYAL
jgi:isopenicillin-N N-acyltransferase-like protein